MGGSRKIEERWSRCNAASFPAIPILKAEAVLEEPDPRPLAKSQPQGVTVVRRRLLDITLLPVNCSPFPLLSLFLPSTLFILPSLSSRSPSFFLSPCLFLLPLPPFLPSLLLSSFHPTHPPFPSSFFFPFSFFLPFTLLILLSPSLFSSLSPSFFLQPYLSAFGVIKSILHLPVNSSTSPLPFSLFLSSTLPILPPRNPVSSLSLSFFFPPCMSSLPVTLFLPSLSLSSFHPAYPPSPLTNPPPPRCPAPTLTPSVTYPLIPSLILTPSVLYFTRLLPLTPYFPNSNSPRLLLPLPPILLLSFPQLPYTLNYNSVCPQLHSYPPVPLTFIFHLLTPLMRTPSFYPPYPTSILPLRPSSSPPSTSGFIFPPPPSLRYVDECLLMRTQIPKAKSQLQEHSGAGRVRDKASAANSKTTTVRRRAESGTKRHQLATRAFRFRSQASATSYKNIPRQEPRGVRNQASAASYKRIPRQFSRTIFPGDSLVAAR
ncbi:hypothetical protein C7M84_018806 [Penaeus vannamei]|uniref:Uncharacterized protein n=1 Tax=Penaeus vannamei TaxID=6689 RepID=A0A3R7PY97_PENVA|nr:hypothetical protein C7M84_018806 [Penaeus vannamei]